MEKNLPIDDLDLTFKEEADPRLLSLLGKIGDGLALIYKTVSKPIVLPKIFHVEGKVEVTRQPSVKIENLRELEKYFDSLEEGLGKKFGNLLLAVQAMPQPQIKMPKIEIPAQMDNKDVIEAIRELGEKLDSIKPQEVNIPKTIEVSNFPTTYIPPTVTHMSINALRGEFLSTLVSVSTQGTALPSTAMPNRRSLMVYNPSSSVTVYLGGAGVTTTGHNQGFPIPPTSYSPALDAGKDMELYGIVASGTQNVNVLEISDEASGR